MYLEPDEAIDLCDEILEDLGKVRGAVEEGRISNAQAAEEFVESVEEKVEDMREWIDANSRCTEGQARALNRMAEGTRKWLSYS